MMMMLSQMTGRELRGMEKGLRRIFQKERSIRGVLLKINRAMPMIIIKTAVPVTTAGNGGKHEGEVPEKKDREHQLSRHLKKVDRIKQERSQPGKDDQDHEDRHVDHQ